MAGVKGRSGRKTMTDEVKRVQALEELFFGRLNVSKLERRIKSGKFTGLEMMKWKVASGDREALLKLFTKVMPDSLIADIETRARFDGIILDTPKPRPGSNKNKG